MYQYDSFDTALVQARVDEFRDQVSRRMSGELSEDQFKPLRLMNGFYLQLHAYMLRVAVPYGTLDSRQLKMLAHIARKYDRGYGHFTTRQNIQYNWIKLEEAPDILADLASVEMHGIQTSGNCIRNITTDQFAGAVAGEVEDPRIWAEILRQYSSFHPEFSFLPRKFKIAFAATPQDRAAIQLHDIGVEIVKSASSEIGFRVYVGGGMGRTPIIAKVLREWVAKADFLSYVEAIMRVYNRYGRRDNIYKARIKILVHELGIEEFRRQVEAEWLDVKQMPVDVSATEAARIATYFGEPAFEETPASGNFNAMLKENAAFATWAERNIHPHKKPGYAIVTISLKAVGEIPGDASADQMDSIADLAVAYSFDDIRVTHEQNLVLPHVKRADLFAVWQKLVAIGLAADNIGLISDIIACPGLDYCALANARSIPIAQEIAQRFAQMERQRDIGELKIKISGCINACGHHHAGHIGILGVDRKGEENYQLSLGGSGAEDASIGAILGPGFGPDAIVDAVEKVVTRYQQERRDGERFLDTYRRIGAAPFKEAVYG
jgi:sulfite reductase (NADPH) hemoprotein beta-component